MAALADTGTISIASTSEIVYYIIIYASVNFGALEELLC